MVTQFKAVLDRVKAEDELVEKTERYLRAKLKGPALVESLYFIRRERRMKKILVACIAAVLVIGVLAGGYTYLETPVAYISLDINPSIELGINALNKVVSSEGVNRRQSALEGQKIIRASLTDALDSLISIAAQKIISATTAPPSFQSQPSRTTENARKTLPISANRQSANQ